MEKVMQNICEELQISDSDRVSYTEDAQHIENWIMEQMKQESAEFRKYFRGLSLTGSYLDALKIKLPDEFDMHMKLEFPNEIEVKKDEQRPGFVFLKLYKWGVEYKMFSEHEHVSRIKLQSWIRGILVQALGNNDTIRLPTGRLYKLFYPKEGQGHAVAHTITAVDVNNQKREISFDFVPVFEFGPNLWPLEKKIDSTCSWFAVPQGKRVPNPTIMDQCTFMVCAPHFERDVLKNKMNLKNSLRLMKALRDSNGMWRLSSYMLKSVYLMEIGDKHGDHAFWSEPIDRILIYMLQQLLDCLMKGNLPFFLDENLNHLDRLNQAYIMEYKLKLENILSALNQWTNRSNLRDDEVRELKKMFGV